MIDLEKVGLSIRETRKRARKSVPQTAMNTGISKNVIYAYERGEVNPGLLNLCLLSEYYGVTLEKLVFGGGKHE